YTTLIILGLFLVYQAIERFFAPHSVDGWLIVIIAAVALLVDLVTAVLTYRLSQDSVNIRAAFLHNLADALGSVAVIVAGTLILLFDWWFVDPLVTLLIAGYILWMSFAEIGDVIRILMLSRPNDIVADHVVSAIRSIEGVRDIHNIRLWQMGEHAAALDGHLVIEAGDWGNADAVKDRVKVLLHERFHIDHSTLELECAVHACADAPLFGHG
ncbi:MAG TPA: cation diffusion facilitator family transporter, partial [Paracoccaceae bacterium]|nr:cation diffusion facilitator family transporter [Paracoccaceae bacterium]